MPLGMEVGLGPADIVLDGHSPTERDTAAPPTFWPISCGRTVAHLSYCCALVFENPR